MYMIISHQYVIFIGLINFCKIFNDIHFIRVILLMGRYVPRIKSGTKNNPSNKARNKNFKKLLISIYCFT